MQVDDIVTYRTDILEFSKCIFKDRKGINFVENWHHKLICEHLEKVVIGRIKRLIINIPPRYSKTELAVINFIAWCIGNYPDSEFIHASYSKRLATNNTWNARSIVESEKYKEIFGDIELRKDSNAKDEWRTNAGGCVYATGADGTITGYGAGGLSNRFKGAIVIDDPHKAGEATSDTMRNNVIDWFSTTIESRTNSPNTPIIIIMQRLHENDLSGFLLNGGNGEKWIHLNIPAINNDKPLWDFKHSLTDLKRLEKSNPYVFAGQYMQLPAPLGGGMYKNDYFKYYEIEPKFDYRLIFADTAQKTKEHNDYSVFQCWGYTRDKEAYLIDQVRGKWEAPQLREMAISFWNKHKSTYNGNLRSFCIEDKSSGTGLIQDLQFKDKIPIRAIQRNNDKITRAMDSIPYLSSGYVYLKSGASYTSELLPELEVFPNGKHDDQVDVFNDGISELFNYGVLSEEDNDRISNAFDML